MPFEGWRHDWKYAYVYNRAQEAATDLVRPPGASAALVVPDNYVFVSEMDAGVECDSGFSAFEKELELKFENC